MSINRRGCLLLIILSLLPPLCLALLILIGPTLAALFSYDNQAVLCVAVGKPGEASPDVPPRFHLGLTSTIVFKGKGIGEEPLDVERQRSYGAGWALLSCRMIPWSASLPRLILVDVPPVP